MLTYEEFKEVFKERLEKEFPEPYIICFEKMEKINRILDAVSVRKNASCECGPNVYLNELYEDYKSNRNLEAFVETIIEQLKQAVQTDLYDLKLDFSQAEDNIVCQIINTEKNKEMLTHMPHREFLDLSIVYRWIVRRDKDGVASCLVKNGLANKLNLTEEQLFSLAWRNTVRLYPPVLRSFKDFLSNVLPEELISDVPMYILSNKFTNNGAIYLTDKHALSVIAENANSDLYILPSSIHECIVVPSTNIVDPNELLVMVGEVNLIGLEVGQRLSNNVYYFDRNSKEVSLVPNDNCKSLNDLEK